MSLPTPRTSPVTLAPLPDRVDPPIATSRMNTPLTLACVLFGLVFCPGCGSTDDTTQSTDQGNAPPPPAAESRPSVSIETRTDTIATLHQQVPEQESPPRKAHPAVPLYRIQVGAFHRAANASSWVAFVRRQLGLPTVSEYSETRGVYRVRVGAFETKREALKYWRKLRRDLPRQFGDAWVVAPGRD
jgi:hypothetical protein